MANVAFTAFLPEVLPLVPGCADVVAVNAIRNACIEFCQGSNIWQETQDPFDLLPADLPYDLEGVSGAKVCRVLSLRVDGQRIDPITMDELDAKFYNWREAQADVPTAYYQPNPDSLALYPIPTGAVNAVFRVAYAPLRTASGVEEYVYQDWLEELAAGALARLMSMPGQSFTNEVAAAGYRDTFEKGISDAAAEANKSFSRAEPMVQMRRFA